MSSVMSNTFLDGQTGLLSGSFPLSWTQSIAIVLVALFITCYASIQTEESKIPAVGYGLIPIPFIQRWIGAIRLVTNPLDLFNEGYRLYKKRPGLFRICSLDREIVVVADGAKTLEYLAAPDDVIGFEATALDIFQIEYTVGPLTAANQFHVPLIKTNLTQHIGSSIAAMREEIGLSFDTDIGHPTKWTEVPLHHVIARTIAKASNRDFFGLELARNEEHISNAIPYAGDVFNSSLVLRNLPEWLKPFAYPFTPVYKRQKVFRRIVTPLVLKRIEAAERGEQVPDDMLQWLVEAAPLGPKRAQAIVEMVMALNVGSVHTTSVQLSAALYQLAADCDKYASPLRQEISDVFGDAQDDQITKQMVNSLAKMDSFLTETGRRNPFGLAMIERTVAKDFRFQDGTLLPAGSYVAHAGHSIQHDPEIFEHPDEFDGFRYERAGKRLQMTNTSPENILFGHGRHACPGRFFAVNEMKLIFCEFLERYDIKLIPGTAPKRSYVGVFSMAETELKVLVRSRAKR